MTVRSVAGLTRHQSYVQGHPEEVYACEFAGPGGRQMFTASADELALWDLETRARIGSCRSAAASADLAGGAPSPACRHANLESP